MHPSYLSTYLSVHHPPYLLTIYHYLSTHPSYLSSIHPSCDRCDGSTHPSHRPIIYISLICSSSYHLSIYPSIISMYPSIHLSIRPSFHNSIPSICPSTIFPPSFLFFLVSLPFLSLHPCCPPSTYPPSHCPPTALTLPRPCPRPVCLLSFLLQAVSSCLLCILQQ